MSHQSNCRQSLGCQVRLFLSVITILALPLNFFPAQAQTFNRMSFTDTNGKVGYHMVSHILILGDDTPTPTRDAVECNPLLDRGGVRVVGDLPPGLSFEVIGPTFLGTPRQPGNWDVDVTEMFLSCSGGPDQGWYGPRTVHVTLRITP